MVTDISTINISLEAFCTFSQEELFVLNLSTNEIIATSPTFDNLDGYYTAALKHWGSEERDYLVHQSDRAGKAAFLSELSEAEDDQLRSVNFRILNPGGGWETISVCFKIIKRDLDAGPLLALGRLQKMLESKEELSVIEDVFNQNAQGLIVWAPLLDENDVVEDFTLHLLNHKAQRLLKRTADELHGKRFSVLFPGEKAQNYLEKIALAFNDKAPTEDYKFSYLSAAHELFSLQFICLPEHLLLQIDAAEAQKVVRAEYPLPADRLSTSARTSYDTENTGSFPAGV